MSNAFWNFNAPLTRQTLARAAALNSLFAGIAAGFDKIPSVEDFAASMTDYAEATGSDGAYVVTLNPTQITAYTTGMRVRFKASSDNAADAATINLNGLGVKSIRSATGALLPAGTITTGSIVDISYDGTYFRLPVTQTITAAEILALILTVDGAGSGLNADLLDGESGAYYADVPARLGYTPANKAGDTFTGNVRSTVGNFFSDAPDTSGNAHYWLRNSSGLQRGVLYWDQANELLSLVRYNSSGIGEGILQIGGSALAYNGHTVWHAGNDGSGSGLDADLLDGQQGSYYADVPARLGYTPLNAASYTAADVMTKVQSLDGAGSGLDADLLDGYQASAFARLGGAGQFSVDLGTTNGLLYAAAPAGQNAAVLLQNEAGVGQATFTWERSSDTIIIGRYDDTGTLLSQYVTIDATNLRFNGAVVYHTGNDGAASGLDADLLDGQQGSYYADVPARLGYTPVRQGGGAGMTTSTIYIGWDGTSTLNLQVDSTSFGGTWPINVSGAAADSSALGGVDAADYLQTAGLGAALAAMTRGAIGTYSILYLPAGGPWTANDLAAGSDLRYSSPYNAGNALEAPSGMWRNMGATADGTYVISIGMRVA